MKTMQELVNALQKRESYNKNYGVFVSILDKDKKYIGSGNLEHIRIFEDFEGSMTLLELEVDS